MNKFEFSISEVAELLGKSPVTLRSWESKGVIVINRKHNGRDDRVFDVTDLRLLVERAYGLKRIKRDRYELLNELLNIYRLIERANNENRLNRASKSRKNKVRKSSK